MRVSGGNHAHPPTSGQIEERLIAGGIERVAVIGQFDKHIVATEQCGEPVELSCRSRKPFSSKGFGDTTFTAPGENDPVTVVRLRQFFEVVDGPTFLLAGELRRADGHREPAVPFRVTRENEQMVTFRIGDAVLRRAQTETEFGTEHRADAEFTGRLGEAHDTVEAVVVGDGEGFDPESRRLFGKFFGFAGAV